MLVRTVAGFLLAPLVVPIGVILTSPTDPSAYVQPVREMLVWGAVWYCGALVFTVVLALPLYLLLNRHNWVRWWVCLSSGLLVGTIGAMAMGNGQRLSEHMVLVLLGGIAGAVFWFIVKYRQQSQEAASNAT